jgi:hypothetical protein
VNDVGGDAPDAEWSGVAERALSAVASAGLAGRIDVVALTRTGPLAVAPYAELGIVVSLLPDGWRERLSSQQACRSGTNASTRTGGTRTGTR